VREDVAARSGTLYTDGTTCKANNDRLLTPCSYARDCASERERDLHERDRCSERSRIDD
jgi:hypothetical protein